MFSWSYVIDYFPKIIIKFPMTLKLVLIPFAISFMFGFAIALLRLKKIKAIDWLLKLYVSYVRCTPVITQMFIVYFGMPILMQNFGIDAYDWEPAIFVYIRNHPLLHPGRSHRPDGSRIFCRHERFSDHEGHCCAPGP